MPAVIFYLLGGTALAATLMCVTRRNPVHAVIYLVNALFALALMFYLLGAPLVAAWEVIIYAGAIMVLFLFIIMMLELSAEQHPSGPGWLRWGPVILLSLVLLGATLLILALDPKAAEPVPLFYVTPRKFARALFERYPLAVEIVSFQLLFAAVGAFYLGRTGSRKEEP